jgi:hypothetical protein
MWPTPMRLTYSALAPPSKATSTPSALLQWRTKRGRGLFIPATASYPKIAPLRAPCKRQGWCLLAPAPAAWSAWAAKRRRGAKPSPQACRWCRAPPRPWPGPTMCGGWPRNMVTQWRSRPWAAAAGAACAWYAAPPRPTKPLKARGAKLPRPSSYPICMLKSTSTTRAISRSKFWPIPTATCCTCSSGIARCSGDTRS